MSLYYYHHCALFVQFDTNLAAKELNLKSTMKYETL